MNTIQPVQRDLGEFSVRRVLPAVQQRAVGPFVFFDHMGPATFDPGSGIQVRPHPHIGIATVTYLFDGQIMHRDSLGIEQLIQPGAVNLMTAGSGIVHSERAGDDLHEQSTLHGIQSWIALPDEAQECEPGFEHYGAADLPQFMVQDVQVKLIMGQAFGQSSPVQTYSPTLYLELNMPAGARFELPSESEQVAAYVVSGAVSASDQTQSDNQSIAVGTLIAGEGKAAIKLLAEQDSHLMIIGGSSVGRRHLWWNFVSSSKERIEQAKTDWVAGRFDPVDGDDEFIPLPES